MYVREVHPTYSGRWLTSGYKLGYAAPQNTTLYDMSQISIYDIDSAKW